MNLRQTSRKKSLAKIMGKVDNLGGFALKSIYADAPVLDCKESDGSVR